MERLRLLIEVDDAGTPRVRSFAGVLGTDVPRAAQKAQSGVQGFARTSTASLSRLKAIIASVAGVSGAMLGGLMVRSVMRTGAAFESAMSGVRAITGATGKAFEDLARQAQHLGATTVFTAVQSANAQERLALAGFQVSEILASMPKVLSLAAAGELDVAEAAGIASDVIRGLGIAAEDFGAAADSMAWAATHSNQTIRDIGEAMKYLAPVARAAGAQIDELAAALAVLANRGIRADMAGTALRRGLSVMLGNLEAGEKGLAKFGIRLTDAQGRFVGLTEAIRRMKAAGMTAAQVMEAFGQRAGPAMLALMQAGAATLQEYRREASEAAGLTDRIAAVRLDNLVGDLRLLRSAWEGLSVTIMEEATPALRDFIQATTRAINAADGWLKVDEHMKAVAHTASALGTILGAALAVQVVAGVGRIGEAMAAAAGSSRLLGASVGSLVPRFATAQAAGTGAMSGIAAEAGAATGAVSWLSGALMSLQASLLVVGTAIASWKLGRAIDEMTGLGKAIQRVMVRRHDALTKTFEEATEKARSLKSLVESLDKKLSSVAGNLTVEVEIRGKKTDARKIIEGYRQAIEDALAEAQGPADLFSRLDAAQEKFGEGALAVARALSTVSRKIRDIEKQEPGLFATAAKNARTLQEAVDRAQAALKAHREQAASDAAALAEATTKLAKAMVKAGVIVGPAFDKVAADWGQLWQAAEANGIRAIDFAKTFTKELDKLNRALTEAQKARLPEGLVGAMRVASELQQQAKAAKEATKYQKDLQATQRRLADEMLRLGQVSSQAAQIVGGELVSKFTTLTAMGFSADQALQAVGPDLVQLAIAAQRSGVALDETAQSLADLASEQLSADGFSPVVEAILQHRYEVERLVAAYRLAGEEIPEQVQQWADVIEEYSPAEHLLETVVAVQEEFRNLTDTIIQGIGDAVASALVDGQSLTDSLTALAKMAIKTVISLLVQLGIAHILWGKIAGKTTAVVDAQRLAGSLANVYTNTFASIAAIPIIGPAMAPGAAAAAVATAAAGAKAAMAAGAALGASEAAAGAPKMAEGGVVTRPTLALIGEAGPEAVIPLSSSRAKQATKHISGGRSVSIDAVNLVVEGSIVAEEGWEEDLIEKIHDGLAEAISSGMLEDFGE